MQRRMLYLWRTASSRPPPRSRCPRPNTLRRSSSRSPPSTDGRRFSSRYRYRHAVEINCKLGRLAGFGLAMRNPAVSVGARVRMRKAVPQVEPNLAIVGELRERLSVRLYPPAQLDSLSELQE